MPGPSERAIPSGKRPGPSRLARTLRALGAANLAALALVWIAENLIGEAHWLTTLMAYAPQQPVALPTLVLLLPTLLARDRIALAQEAGALCLCGIVLGLHTGWLAPRAEGRALVRVLTWNIHLGSDDIRKVARDIQQIHPDIVCLQESYPRNVDELKPLLPQYSFVHAGDTAIGTRHRLQDHQVYPFGFGHRGDRLLLTAHLQVDGQTLLVGSTHLATAAHSANLFQRGIRRHMADSNEVRSKAVQTLQSTFSQENGPVLLCGDFNTPPRGLLYRRLAGYFRDAFAVSGRGFGYTYRADRRVLRIDYIFTRGGVDPVSTRVLDTDASDHLPVLAEIALPR